jgi:hypothetical protein
MKMTLGGKEIKGSGPFSMTSVPWYLRWWYDWKLYRCRKAFEQRWRGIK